MMYRFYLDGILVDEPTGWKELVTTFKYYDEVRGVLLTQDVTLGFVGTGYTYLKNIFDSSSVCSLIELVIQYNCSGNYEEIFKGTIFITSCSFQDNVCKTKVEDDSFFAKINNNKSIKAYVDVARSKNDVTITAATSVVLNMFNPCTCLTYPVQRVGWRIEDCFRYIISFMSDGEVDFISDYFSTGTGADHLIAVGEKLRNPANVEKSTIPFFSFQEILGETNKKYNLGIDIELIGGRPTVRIEEQNYFRTQTTGITLANPSNIKISADLSQLYAKIDIGSSDIEMEQACTSTFPASFDEGIDYMGFKQETFPLLTECNIDTTLNLVSSWVISSNVIQVVLASSPDYDTKIFFIEAVFNAGEYDAVQTDILTDGGCFYNGFYTNFQTIQRWNDSLPASVLIIFSAVVNNNFAAVRGFNTNVSGNYNTIQERHSNDYSGGANPFVPAMDPANNYGNGTPQFTPVTQPNSYFTVPLGWNGAYNFRALIQLINILKPGTGLSTFQAVMTITITINTYDDNTFASLIDSVSTTATINLFNQVLIAVPPFVQVVTPVYNLVFGNVARVNYDITIVNNNFADNTVTTYTIWGDPNPLTYPPGKSYFKTDQTPGYGGSITVGQGESFPNLVFDFEYPITFEQFKILKADTKKFIQFNHCGRNYRAWIKEIKYNHHKNSKLILITNKNEYRNNP